MNLRRSFDKLFNKQYVCWVCLDAECDDDEWIVHQCGCNLQVHRKCLIGWMYDLNKSKLGSYYTYDTYKINSAQEISRRLCYLIDSNRDMGREIGFAETVQDIPLVGQTWASFICVGDLLIRALAHFNAPDSSFSYDELWRGLPQDVPPCPQCKQKLLKNISALKYRSSSWLLRAFSMCRQVSRYSATILTLHGYAFNPVKSLFKVGLYQLRYLFSEGSLRKIFDISNTKALDVYAESVKGMLSIPADKKITIIGFPLYLLTFKAKGTISLLLRVIFPYYFLKNCRTHKLLNNAITFHGVVIGVYNLLVRPALNKMYASSIEQCNPYFLSRRSAQKSGISPSNFSISFEGVDNSDIIIKSQWYDTVLSALAWPFFCKYMGQRLVVVFPKLNSAILDRYPSATPDDCEMAHSLICSLALYIGYEFMKMGITYLRLKELQDIQRIVNVTPEPTPPTESEV
ncbi:unnamed protein product [Kluyveromyces dobzhanskii CBS 2104]|uniref:WGS project CCBQ000000000 data, contig 00102 n=1 Tax=Kluyveromyces dobzhanskii CBS 2104 TaxID=1427455 RepID=A0A0A8L6H2_9SACH|nr:unnamed protein product [Kluyveromyces dobzhanskii CBS 2104]